MPKATVVTQGREDQCLPSPSGTWPGRAGPSSIGGGVPREAGAKRGRKADQEGEVGRAAEEGATRGPPRRALLEARPPAGGAPSPVARPPPRPWTSCWQCCPGPGLLLHSGLKGHVCTGAVTGLALTPPRGCLLGSTVVRGAQRTPGSVCESGYLPAYIKDLRGGGALHVQRSRTGRGFMRASDTQPSLQLFYHAQHAHLPHGPIWLLELEPLNVYSSQWEREWVERPLFLPGRFPSTVTPSWWPELSPVATPGCEGGQDTRPWLSAVTSRLGTKEWER